MVATCAIPEQSLNAASSKMAQKETGIDSPSEAMLTSSNFHDTAGKSAPPNKHRDPFLIILLRALGAPHF